MCMPRPSAVRRTPTSAKPTSLFTCRSGPRPPTPAMGRRPPKRSLSPRSNDSKTSTHLSDVARGHFQRVVQDLVKRKKYDEAVVVAQRAVKLLKEEGDRDDLVGLLYDTWTESFRNKKEWESAIEIYGKGLAKFPKSQHLEQNVQAAWYQWADGYTNAKDWDAAIKVYERALKAFPENGTFKNNLNFCKQQKGKK